jgi:hypothetical protein
MKTIDLARKYVSLGFALARVSRTTKRPFRKGWNTRSALPEEFRGGDNIGLQTGRLSGDAVCIDLDCRLAVELAPQFLPPTGMIDGRPGKPASHWWFRVVNIPSWLIAPPSPTSGLDLGGPGTRKFTGPDGMIVEFRGTWHQAVVPPSVWSDGQTTEVRCWDRVGEPAVVDAAELLACVERLAKPCGYVKKEKERKGQRPAAERVAPDLALPAGREAVERALAYVAKIDGVAKGGGRSAKVFEVACILVVDFFLSDEEALAVLAVYNQRVQPPYDENGLLHKIRSARAKGGDWGCKLRRRTVGVRLGGGPVYVGVGVEGMPSHVGLRPSLWAAIDTFGGKFYSLTAEVEAVDWRGRQALLCPSSTIATNSKLVWAEHVLATLLSKKGALVRCVRLPPSLRMTTLADVDPTAVYLIDPLLDREQAKRQARAAKLLAKQLDPVRKALPRNKPSPELDKAIRWIKRNRVVKITKEVMKKAKRAKISKSTLKRAMTYYLIENPLVTGYSKPYLTHTPTATICC